MSLKQLNAHDGTVPVPKDWKPDTHFLDYKYDKPTTKTSTNDQQRTKEGGQREKKPLAGVVKTSK